MSETIPQATTTVDAEPIKRELLRVDEVSKFFPVGSMFSKQRLRALNNVTFKIDEGECVALVGESGSGKSTMARLIARLDKIDSGQIQLDGKDALSGRGRRATRTYRGAVQMVFQDPFGSLNPVHQVRHFLGRAYDLHHPKHSSRERDERLEELMDIVGLRRDMLDSFPHELSGGQRQRVAIARALAVDPRLVLADEPTSMLDVSVRVGILNLMDDLKREHGLSFLYITHDLASARYLADRTLVMYGGELVEGGESLELMENPSHPYTQLLVSAVPDPRRDRQVPKAKPGMPPLIDPNPGCPFAPRCPKAMAQCSTVTPEVTQLGEGHWVKCHLFSSHQDAVAASNPLPSTPSSSPITQ